jgi:hypothetical protein
MQAIKRAFLYGFLNWLLPFVFSVIIFPLKKSDPVFFQSLITVFSVLILVILAVSYFKKVQGNLKEGVFLGLIFLLVSLFFDFFFFIWGPIKMQPIAYIKEIGIQYLNCLTFTIGIGYLLKARDKKE